MKRRDDFTEEDLNDLRRKVLTFFVREDNGHAHSASDLIAAFPEYHPNDLRRFVYCLHDAGLLDKRSAMFATSRAGLALLEML